MGGCSSSDLTSTQNTSPVLSNNEIDLIRSSWGPIVDSGLKETGTYMMTRLFTQHPELKKLYSFAKNLENEEEMMSNELVNTHGEKLFTTIGTAISSLDDMNSLIPILVQLGSSHRKWGVKEEHFETVGGVLLDTLSDGLKEKFTPEVKQAWLKFYNIVSINMKSGLNQF